MIALEGVCLCRLESGFQDKLIIEKKERADHNGRGRVHLLMKIAANGSRGAVYVQLPRAVTFGIRDSGYSRLLGYRYPAAPIKYRLTLKFDHEVAVEQLRDVHSMIKEAIIDSFNAILPKTTDDILKKDDKIPKNLFEQTHDLRRFSRAKKLFARAARERLDEIFVFGTEEDFDLRQYCARPMVRQSRSRTPNHDDKKTWYVDVRCAAARDVYSSDHSPIFKFTASEGPEDDLDQTTIIPNENMLDKLAPANDESFSRDAIAVVSLPYIHVRDDESSVCVNISLRHLHALA